MEKSPLREGASTAVNVTVGMGTAVLVENFDLLNLANLFRNL